MKGFRAGLMAGLRAERPKKPLTEKEKKRLERLLRRKRATEAVY